MDRRDFCIEFIETSKCDKGIDCKFAHIIIEENQKELFLEHYKKLNKDNSNIPQFQSSQKTMIGKNKGGVMTKCSICGKGFIYKKHEYTDDDIHTKLCKVCVGEYEKNPEKFMTFNSVDNIC